MLYVFARCHQRLCHRSRGEEFEGKVSVWGELKVVKSCSHGGTSYSLLKSLLLYDVSFSHNTLRHRQTDRRTDRPTKWWQ